MAKAQAYVKIKTLCRSRPYAMFGTHADNRVKECIILQSNLVVFKRRLSGYRLSP
jgi:hypothetical protein